MLGEILSKETCAKCRLCCGFDCTDLWELPILPEETVDAIHALGKVPPLTQVGTEQTFAAPELVGDQLFSCPMLSDTGCIMGEEKPFDCKIWPFRMMADETGSCRIAVAAYCSGVEKYTDEELHAFLAKGLGETILAYAKTHPAHVKPYSDFYRFVW